MSSDAGVKRTRSEKTLNVVRASVRDLRIAKLLPVLIALSICVGAWLLYLTRYSNFYGDEWTVVSNDRGWDLTLFLAPTSLSWSSIPTLVWKLLFVIVGIRSHIPYEMVVITTHLLAVTLLFGLVQRWSGDLPALGAALLLLLLGSGGPDIVFADQIGYTISVALGLVAMLSIARGAPRVGITIASSAALLGSTMSSAVGLAFLAAVTVQILAQRRWLAAVALMAPAGAWEIWSSFHNGLLLVHSGLLPIAAFMAWGLQATAAAIFAVPGIGGALLPMLATLIVLQWYRQRRPYSWQVALTVGLLVWFGLIGIPQAEEGPSVAARPEFVYVGFVFLIPQVAHLYGQIPWRRASATVAVAALASAVVSNSIQLYQVVGSRSDIMRTENAELQTAEVFRGAPDMALHRPLDNQFIPQLDAAHYFAATQELGTPVQRTNIQGLDQLSHRAVDRAMLSLFGEALTVSIDPLRSTNKMVCEEIDLANGSALQFQLADGQSLMLQSTELNIAFVFMGYMEPPTSQPVLQADLAPKSQEWLHMPDTGQYILWRLVIRLLPIGTLRVCGLSDMNIRQGPGAPYSAYAASGARDAGWLSVSDPTGANGFAAKAGGTFDSPQNDVFGNAFVPMPGAYDVWYRVRLEQVTLSPPEMTLGLWDDQAQTWIGSTRYRSDQLGTSYSWVLVAASVRTTGGHSVHFVTSFVRTLSTSWYVDEALMVPATSQG